MRLHDSLYCIMMVSTFGNLWKLVLMLSMLLSECLSLTLHNACKTCHCGKHNVVDCSGRNLMKIPALPEGTAFLNFNSNNLSALSRDILKPVPRGIKRMSFGNCRIRRVPDSNIFVSFPKLTTFNIGENDLDKKAFANVLMSVKVSELISLNISGNNLRSFQHELNFTMLSKLKYVLMNDCNISSLTSVLQTNTARRFEELELQRNCIDAKELQSFFKYGAYYDRLRLLKLSSNPIEKVLPNTFSKIKGLWRLLFSKLGAKKSTFKGINSSTLRYLDITDSFTFAPAASKDMFKLTPNLFILNISETNLSSWTETDFQNLFAPMKSLESLGLSQTSLITVPCDSLKTIANLHSLDISGNQIKTWNETCFKGMPPSLNVLYLNRNLITNINEKSFPRDFINNLRKLHLYDNRFRCNCSIHWFRSWMKNNYAKLDALDHDKHFIYQCASPPGLNGTLLVNYDPDYEKCNGLSTYEVVAIGIAGFATIFIVTVLVLKKLAYNHEKKGYVAMNSRETMFD